MKNKSVMEMCVISLRFCWFPFLCIYVGMLFAYQTTTTTKTISSRLSYSYVRFGLCVSLSQLFSSCQLLYVFHYTHIFIILHHHGVDLGLGIQCYRVFPFVYIVFIPSLCVFLFEGNCSRKSSRLPGLWTIWLREEIIHNFHYPVTGTGNGRKHDYWLQSVRNIVIKTSGAWCMLMCVYMYIHVCLCRSNLSGNWLQKKEGILVYIGL